MSSDFSIVLIGQAAFGEKVLNALVDSGENIAGVFCSPDKPDRPVDPIKSAALEHDIPVFQFKRMRDAQAIDAFKNLNADLGVMAFVTDIVPMEILQAPTQGTIQYHPSLLPKHRGPSSINWPIIQGETKTGLSIFWPDDGLDTGPILMQREVTIGPDDTLGTVYFDNLFSLGVDALVESIGLVKGGVAPRIEQNHELMTYEGWCKVEDTVIDWSENVDTIYNLIRGADPSPGASTTFQGESIQFYNASKSRDRATEPPGTIISIGGDGMEIACTNGTITVRRVKPKGAKKISVAEWSVQADSCAGQRFGE